MFSDNGGPDYRDVRLEQYEKLIPELRERAEKAERMEVLLTEQLKTVRAQLEEEKEEVSYFRAALGMTND